MAGFQAIEEDAEADEAGSTGDEQDLGRHR